MADKFSKRSRSNNLGRLVDSTLSFHREENVQLESELDFIVSPSGLKIDLYPMQRIMVKATFGIPLDYKPVREIVFWNMHKTEIVRTFKGTDAEKEAVKYLFDQGKALAVDELIPTPTGFRRMGDLAVGDEVFSPDGSTTTISHTHVPFEDDVYRVIFDDGTNILAHRNHLWFTNYYSDCKTKRPKYIRTTEQIANTLSRVTSRKTQVVQYNHSIPLPQPVDMPTNALPIDPYCLGYWLGDGHSKNAILTSPAEDMTEVLPHFEAQGYRWRSFGKFWWGIYGLYRPLRILGVIGNKHIPEAYLWASVEQRLALLQGLCDSDGSCTKDGQVEFSNINKKLAEGVYHLACSLGIKASWSERPANLEKKRPHRVYVVRWFSATPVFRISRKLVRLTPGPVRGRRHARFIKSIEPAGKTFVRCVTVDNPNGLFLVGRNFNITHNCNIEDWRDIPAKGFSTIVGYCGRRAGKSETVSGISGAMLRNLLSRISPQEYYGLVDGSVLDFSFMGTEDTGAKRIYAKLRSRINASPYFNPFIRSNTIEAMEFVTLSDRDNREALPSIKVAAYPCTEQAARGPSNYFIALDEFQFFRSNKDSNSHTMYKAATPSTAQFAPPDDPENPDSKVMVISSPATRIGKMYELSQTALEGGAGSGIFYMRLSTVEMNPRIPRTKLEQEYRENKDTFKAEWGGEFLDGAGSYIPEFKFNIAVDKDRPNTTQLDLSSIGRKYFWGLDLGMQNDATALAISHLEMTEGRGVQLIYDYIDRMMVGEMFTGPGVDLLRPPGEEKYLKDTKLEILDILAWLVYMHQVLPCFKGATDQHAGLQVVQLLQLNSITEFELMHFTMEKNSKMAYSLKGFLENDLCRFPDVPKFATEFKMLEAQYINKYALKVEAPSEKGAHDDMYDAAAISAMLAQTWLQEEGKLDRDPSGKVLQVNPALTGITPVINPSGLSVRDLRVLDRYNNILKASTLPQEALMGKRSDLTRRLGYR